MAKHEIWSSRNPHRVRVIVEADETSRTRQCHKDECDINTILAQYKRTGIFNHISSRQGSFIDLPSNYDLQEALAVVREANEAFADLPAKVRDRFKNDPGEFLAALQNPALKDELCELGVFIKPAPAAKMPAEPPEAPTPSSPTPSSR